MIKYASLLLVMAMLTGCVINVPVETGAPVTTVPVRSSPAITPPPVVVSPPVESLPAPAPPAQELSPPVAPPPEIPAPAATPASTLLSSVQAAVAAGEPERAAALAERALRISPRDAQLWYQLALIRLRQNRLDDATGAARRALNVAADRPMQQQIALLLQEISDKAAADRAK